jgi:hypothetical protein
MPSSDRFIAACRSWDDFWDRARNLSDARAFERLTQLYLETAPVYRTKLQEFGCFARCLLTFADD